MSNRNSPTAPSRHSTPDDPLSRVDINNSTPNTLRRVLREAQASAAESREVAKGLRRGLADVTNSSDQSNKRRRVQDSDSASDSEGSDLEDRSANNKKLVQDMATHYTIMYGLWLLKGEATFKIQPDANYSPLAMHRFDSVDSKVQGQLADLKELVGEEWREDKVFKKLFVRKTFCKQMQQQRSNTSNRLRKQCGSIIFQCDPLDLTSTSSRSAKFMGCIGGKVSDGNAITYDTWNAEVLHKEYEGRFDVKKIFLNPFLMRVFVAITHGQSAVTSFVKNGVVVSQGQTMSSKFGLTHVTPGAIAASAVLACWTLSPDNTLVPIGGQSGIKYRDIFDEFLGYLQEGLDQKKKSVLDIFKAWDEAIFPHTKDTGLAAGKGASSGGKSFKDAMQMLKEDDAEPEDSEQEADKDNENHPNP